MSSSPYCAKGKRRREGERGGIRRRARRMRRNRGTERRNRGRGRRKGFDLHDLRRLHHLECVYV
jgi:hypothetical protein